MVKLDMKKTARTFPAGVHAYGSFCHMIVSTLLGIALVIHRGSENEENSVGFSICNNLKNDPISIDL